MDAVELRLALGRVIREQRESLDHSQESFAHEVGVHRTYMGAIERGERNVSLENLVRIADALGTRLSQLIAAGEKAARR